MCAPGALAACSDGAARLAGGEITTASLGISNQDRIIRKVGTTTPVVAAPTYAAPPAVQPAVPVSEIQAAAPTATRVTAEAAAARRDSFGSTTTAKTTPKPTIGANGVPVIPPAPKRVASLSTANSYSSTGTVKRAAKVSAAPSIARPASPREMAAGGTHTVASGDTLYAIARRHGVSVSAITAANGLTGSALRIGQTLTIPQGGDTPVISTPTIATVESKAAPVKVASVEPQNRATPARRTEPAQKAPVVADGNGKGMFRWPVRGKVIAGFGQRTAAGRNDGIDIAVPVGTPVKAIADGKVLYSGSEIEGFGNLILVRHANSWVSAYANSSSNLVKRGEKVSAGQTIAKSGKSGDAAQPQLHFELRRNSQPVDPAKHLR